MKLIASSSYLPKREIDNKKLAHGLGIDENFIEKRTGIKKRYFVADETLEEMVEALEDDLNTANALTVLYDVLKSELNNATKLYLIKDFDNVLSLNLLSTNDINEELLKFISEKIEERNEAKKQKNYELADKIREELQSKGIILKDTREGTTFEVM